MSGILLDTSVVSETTKSAPAPGVIAFLQARDDFWLPVVVVHELEFGLLLLPPGRRRDGLRQVLSALIAEFTDRILPLGRQEAEYAAALRAQARLAGRALDLGDALIAATAGLRGLSVATRNEKDFDGLGIAIVNPWRELTV